MSQTVVEEREPQQPEPRSYSTFAVPKGKDDWFTPLDFGKRLDREFDLQTWDPCPLMGKQMRLFDGLKAESPRWIRRYRMNPPYSNVRPWLQIARRDQVKGKLVVVILRGDPSTVWFHELVLPYAEVRLVRGRVRFGGKGPAPFATIVGIFRPGKERAGMISVMKA